MKNILLNCVKNERDLIIKFIENRRKIAKKYKDTKTYMVLNDLMNDINSLIIRKAS